MPQLDVLPAEDGGQPGGGRGRVLRRPQAAALHPQGETRPERRRSGANAVLMLTLSLQRFQAELSIGHQILHAVIADALHLLQGGEVEDR